MANDPFLYFPTTKYSLADFIVVGAGIVGLATAIRLLQARPGAKVIVLEKESAIAMHQTGHNSGVIHTGIYYRPGSLKAKTCVAGAKELVTFCEQQGITIQKCGKIIVAVTEEEIPRLDELERRGRENGVENLRRLDQSGLRALESEVNGIAALHVPGTAIVDFKQVAEAYAHTIRTLGGEVVFNSPVTQVAIQENQCLVEAGGKRFACKHLVNCAGLYADRLANMAGVKDNLSQILPFRGEYYYLAPQWSQKVRHLIYPVPDPRFPFLGVHLTLKIDGSIEAGPNAILATAREGYSKTCFNLGDCLQYLGYRGFWKMVGRYWKMGLTEAYRSCSKRAFVNDLRKLIPAVQSADLQLGGAGVRAQVVLKDGSLFDDFLVYRQGRATHVLNAPSPAATASLAIGRYIAEQVLTPDEFRGDFLGSSGL